MVCTLAGRFLQRVALSSVLALTPVVATSATAGNLAQFVRDDHPDVYTVVKGDTLWGISGSFLERPWLWPEIWHVNPQIENPHLIYPGDRIRFEYVDGQPRLTLERGNTNRSYKMSPGDTRLSPKIRATPLESAIPAISLGAIQGFLVQNRVVEPEVFEASPYVVQGDSERLVLGAGDRLYARGELNDSQTFSFVRKGPIYIDPESKEILGREATYIGMGEVLAQEGDISTMLVRSSRERVQIADRVMPTEERRLDSTFYPKAPETEMDGEIISVFSGVTQVGQYDVVVLNRGLREGLDVGNVLAIYKKGALARDRVAKETVRLPSERSGLMMVFRSFEKMSYALVLQADRALSVGDEIRNP